MKLLVSERKMKEYTNERVNMEVRFRQLQDSHKSHLDSCTEFSKKNAEELATMKETIKENNNNLNTKLDELKADRVKQHAQNLFRINTLLITIILAILGYITEKAFERIWPGEQTWTSSSTTTTNSHHIR